MSMIEETLIDAVREYPFLYDSTDSSYHDSKKKEKAWREISTKFDNMTADMCKKRWTSLRDSFRKAHRMRISSSKDGVKKKRPWRYEKEMSFITPYLYGKELISDLSSCDDHQLQEIKAVLAEKNLLGDTSSMDSNSEFILETSPEENEEEIFTESFEHQPSTPEETIPVAQTSKRRKSECATVLKKVKKETIPPDTVLPLPKSDALTTFFKAMEDTVRGFSPGMVIEAKGKISVLVNQLELKNWEKEQLISKPLPNQ